MDKQTDTKKKKNLKNQHWCHAGPPDNAYLYYPLDVEGVTLKGSLLPAILR